MSADSLAKNTQIVANNLRPKCLPKPKSFGFLKSSLWVFVVRAQIGYSLLTKIYPTYTTLKHYQLNADKPDTYNRSNQVF